MPFLNSFAKAFVSALVVVLACAMFVRLVLSWPLQLWSAFGIATGIAIAAGARAQWPLSRAAGILISGLSAGIFVAIGQWLSVRF
jgi:hypothetical protein